MRFIFEKEESLNLMSEKEMARNLKKHEFSMLSDKVNVEEIIAKETERLSKQFCKTFLDYCNLHKFSSLNVTYCKFICIDKSKKI